MTNKIDVQNKVFTGSILMLISRMIVKSIGLVSSIILARLLLPEDFGIVAIAMAIYAFIDLFGAFGFGTVLIQKQNATVTDYNTAWTFKLLFGICAAALLVLLAPWVAAYYQDPRLTNVIYTISLMAVLSGCTNIGVIDFQKNLDFRKELKLQVIPKLLSFSCTMALVVMLDNYWALVFGMLVNETLNVIFSFYMNAFRPRFSLASARELFGFSKWLMLNNAIDYINKKVPILLTGQLLDSKAVGLFSVGEEIALLPTSELAAPINRATYPVYAKLKDDKAELRKAYLNTINLSATISLPAAAGIALLSPMIVNVVLGAAWLEMADMMRLIAITGFIFNLSSNVGYVFMAMGSPLYSVLTNLLRAIIFIPCILVFIPTYGITGIGYALVITSIVMLVVTHISISNLLKLNTIFVIIAISRAIIASAVMSVVVYFAYHYKVGASDLLKLLLMVFIGIISYSSTLLIAWIISGRPDGLEKIILKKIKNHN